MSGKKTKIEQGIVNTEVKKQNFIIRYSLWDIRYSFFTPSNPRPLESFIQDSIYTLHHLYGTRHGDPTPSAKGGKAEGFTPPLHGVDQGDNKSCTG